MASVFFSYSHKDEDLRNEFEVHLSGLKRQGVISTWHDRRIAAGTELRSAIDGNLSAVDVILLLVSPDFINSDYCYEKRDGPSDGAAQERRGESHPRYPETL